MFCIGNMRIRLFVRQILSDQELVNSNNEKEGEIERWLDMDERCPRLGIEWACIQTQYGVTKLGYGPSAISGGVPYKIVDGMSTILLINEPVTHNTHSPMISR